MADPTMLLVYWNHFKIFSILIRLDWISTCISLTATIKIPSPVNLRISSSSPPSAPQAQSSVSGSTCKIPAFIDSILDSRFSNPANLQASENARMKSSMLQESSLQTLHGRIFRRILHIASFGTAGDYPFWKIMMRRQYHRIDSQGPLSMEALETATISVGRKTVKLRTMPVSLRSPESRIQDPSR